MLHFSKWKLISILLVVAFGFLLAIPNLFSEQTLKSFPDWMPKSQVALGLDLQGGVHLQVKIERGDILKDRLKNLKSDIRALMRDEAQGKLGYTSVKEVGNKVIVRLLKPEDKAKVITRLETLQAPVTSSGSLLGGLGIVEVEVNDPTPLSLEYILTEDGISERLRSAVAQSIEVIRGRVDELGTTEPVITRQGEDRIIIQAPGFNDPERLKLIIGKTAKLGFHVVDESVSVNDVGTRPPIGSIVIPTDDPESGEPLILIAESALIKGEDLVDAQQGFDQRNNEPIVSFRFNNKASKQFCKFSSANVGKRFAIVLDNTSISAPEIQQAICGGSGQISGSFTAQSANDLAILMRAGALPADITFVEERTVGSSLGEDSIQAGKFASVIAGILVIVFMLLAYGTLGVIANIALFANIVIIVGVLSLIGATLTLPGIAGIVLTMGMAVDANVLIYERIREERRAGRSVVQAIDTGFKQALGTILDANITTLIAAFILFYLGSGPVKGFAVTLAIGIITSVFTAFTLTRLLVTLGLRWKKPDELPGSLIKLVPDVTKIAFMVWRKISFPLSAVLLVGSLIMFVTVNLNYGIDFKGGTMVEYQTKDNSPANIGDVRGKLSDLNLGDVQVIEFGKPSDILVRIESQDGGDNAEQSALAKVRDALDQDYSFRRQEVVGPTVSGELARAGTIAVIASLLAIMVYIWFRFEWQFALGAVIATVHDVILTIGMFALLQIEFSLSSIAAILTIVGYSLNDTVVVYDRIRENLRKYKKKPINDLLDMSINDTLSRTVMTSVTTLLALLALYFLGGEVLSGFTFAMIFGVVVGTYSSIFIAAPVLILFKLRPGAMDRSDPSPYTGQEAQEVK